MKKLLISAGAVTALALSTPAFALNPNQANATATVNIVSPLSLTKNSDMNFGTIVGPFASDTDYELQTDGTLASCATTCAGTPSAATFTVTGTANQAVKFTYQSSVNLAGPSGNLSVDLTTDHDADPTLDGSGSATYALGGTLTVLSGTTDGLYTGNFDVTVDYQ